LLTLKSTALTLAASDQRAPERPVASAPQKGTQIAVSKEHLKLVAAELNGRARKVLNWFTPAEIYAPHCNWRASLPSPSVEVGKS
jgi:hypothetical protein